jgi:hypothetical protein
MGSGVLGDEQDARVASVITRTRPNRHARQIMGRPYVSSTNQRVQVEACKWRPASLPNWHRFTKPPDRRRRPKLFAEAHGLTSVERLVHRVIMSQREHLRSFGAWPSLETDDRSVWSPADTSSSCRTGVQWSVAHRHLME